MTNTKSTQLPKIHPGCRIGKIEVREPTDGRKNGYMIWQCKCDCGKELLLDTRVLQRGTITDCGCYTKVRPGQKDLTGQRFGKLVCLAPTDKRGSSGGTVWQCKCDCGTSCMAVSTQLTNGYKRSCGCLSKPPRKDWVIELIKRYLKAGVMENGLLVKTTEGSPQGGPLSPLLANIYLNEYDKEMESRGVPVIRYADDIVVLAKSPRAAQRLLESTQRYLEGKLKLKVNVEKSKVVSVFSIRNFRFLGFALGKGKGGVYIRVHAKSMKKAKAKLKELTSRSQGRNVRKVMENVKVYIRGWLGYFGIASMKTTMQRWDEWLRRRIRVYIWKQWKVPKARIRNLVKLGIPKYQAHKWGYVKAYWNVAGSPVLQRSITNERLAQAGYYSILARYESLHLSD